MASSPIPFIRTIRAFGFPFLSTVARVIAFGSLTCDAIASSNHFLKRVIGSSGRLTSGRDRKSTRLNSSHVAISYAVFCLKKKNPPCRDLLAREEADGVLNARAVRRGFAQRLPEPQGGGPWRNTALRRRTLDSAVLGQQDR